MISKYLSLTVLLGAILFSSCVPNRKTVLLQYGDELKDKDIYYDSVLRGYKPKQFEYRIQPEDVLSVRVTSLTQDEYDFFRDQSNQNVNVQAQQGGALLTGFLVDYEGNIEFPVVGNIKVSGLSLNEAEIIIQERAKPFLKNPVVDIRLLNFRFTILGEVEDKGVVSIFNNRTHIIEAIGLAGGANDLADLSRVKVIRHEAGLTNVYYLNLLDESIINSDHYYIHNNDVIIVSPLKQKPFRQYFGQNLTLVVSSLSLLLLTINLIN